MGNEQNFSCLGCFSSCYEKKTSEYISRTRCQTMRRRLLAALLGWSVLCCAGVKAAPVNTVLISAPSDNTEASTTISTGDVSHDDTNSSPSRSLYSYRANVITPDIVFLVHAEVRTIAYLSLSLSLCHRVQKKKKKHHHRTSLFIHTPPRRTQPRHTRPDHPVDLCTPPSPHCVYPHLQLHIYTNVLCFPIPAHVKHPRSLVVVSLFKTLGIVAARKRVVLPNTIVYSIIHDMVVSLITLRMKS